MRRILMMLVLLSLSIGMTSAQGDCGALPSRLVIGERGVVTPGDANNVRAEPNRGATQVGRMAGRTDFDVLAGPVCADGFTWWQVSYRTITGWTVEGIDDQYALEPLNGIVARYEDTSIIVPYEIAESVTVTYHEGTPDDPNDEYAYDPPYLEFVLVGYPGAENLPPYFQPKVAVYASDAFDEDRTMLGDAGQYTVEQIQIVLDEEPELLTFWQENNYRLPDLSPNVSQTIAAHAGYLDFINGRGIRFLTSYVQDFYGPTQGLTYSFTGMTERRSYFIVGKFPTVAPDIPDDFDRAAAANNSNDDGFGAYRDYQMNATAFMDAFTPEQFSVDLRLIDAVIQSLYVGVEE